MEKKNSALLALGSNLGDREKNICEAVNLIIERKILSDVKWSSVYETEPVGFTEQPNFLNACLCGNTDLNAENLLSECKKIEQEIGRIHREKWHEREIDIDILMLGEEFFQSKTVTIPHPRIRERRFVLVPASEIAGEAEHPVHKKKISELLRECTDSSKVKFFSLMKCGNENS